MQYNDYNNFVNRNLRDNYNSNVEFPVIGESRAGFGEQLEYAGETLEGLVNIIIAISLIHRLFIKKDWEIRKQDIVFVLMLLVRITMPEINILLLGWQVIKISGCLKRYLKENVAV